MNVCKVASRIRLLIMEDGWKITHFLELSSSLYCSHHQPITPFLEDMADFFTYWFIY